jgi:hypothetical protein
MTTVTLDPRDFLRPKLIEGVVNRELEQNLSFLDVFDIVPTQAKSIAYSEDLVSATDDISDGVMGKPLDMNELSQLTSIEVSTITQKHEAMGRFGYQVKVSKDDIERGEVIDDLSRAVSRCAFGMAKKINDDILTKLKAVSNDITEVSGAAVWSADTATPVEDIMSFAEAMDLETYPYELKRLYLNKTNYYELMKYLQGIDINWVLDPMKQGQRSVPDVNGVGIHKLYTSELAEGAYLGLDDRPGMAALTSYAYNPAGFGKNGEYPLVFVNQYEEEKYPHNVVTEFIAEMAHVIKTPNAVSYRASGI